MRGDLVETRGLLGLGAHLSTGRSLLAIDLTLSKLAVREGQGTVVLLGEEVLLVLEFDLLVGEVVPRELLESVDGHLLGNVLGAHEDVGGDDGRGVEHAGLDGRALGQPGDDRPGRLGDVLVAVEDVAGLGLLDDGLDRLEVSLGGADLVAGGDELGRLLLELQDDVADLVTVGGLAALLNGGLKGSKAGRRGVEGRNVRGWRQPRRKGSSHRTCGQRASGERGRARCRCR